jgi:hydroxyethylthiazole kinase
MGDDLESRHLGSLSTVDNKEFAWKALQACRAKSPLVHCITNYVSMDFMANTLLSIGASPAMVHSLQEVGDFQKLCSSLLINIGTLEPKWVDAMETAIQSANAANHPWVLDPVGVGATNFRRITCSRLLRLKPTVIRGNASEIIALAAASGATVPSKGVDSIASPHDAIVPAISLAKKLRCIVAISGAQDLVTDGTRVNAIKNGDKMLSRITASGCSVTAIVAAFLGILSPIDISQAYEATCAALGIFSLAGEIVVAEGAKGPGSLRVGLLDKLYTLTEEEVEEGLLCIEVGGLAGILDKFK